MMVDRQPGSTDLYVGARIRFRRLEQGLTQKDLGERAGLTIRHIHDYETGRTRVAVANLVLISMALNVPIAWFFEGPPATADTAFEDQADALAEFMAMPEAMMIIKVWPTLGYKRRKEVSALIEAMGWSPSGAMQNMAGF